MRTTTSRWIVPAAVLVGLVGATAPATAERLVSSLSNHRVMVTSNFTGDEVVLFGGIEQDANSKPRRGGYDIVVTVAGPRQTLVTFRKSRVLGIWVNTESRVFDNAPAYLAVLPTGRSTPSPVPKRCSACSSASRISPCPSAPAKVPSTLTATIRSARRSSSSGSTPASIGKSRTA